MHPSSPIFVVGAPRSGTTLLAASIAAHPSFRGGPESHFFLLPDSERRAAVDDPEWPKKAVELLSSVQHPTELLIEAFGVTSAQLSDYLHRQPPSQAAMLAALFDAPVEAAERKRWVEKSPSHALRLRELGEHFPDAPIIHVVRDPRDTARSMANVPWGWPSTVANAWLWKTWLDRISRQRKDADLAGNVIDVRYEDFLVDPATTLQRICSAAGIDFDERMLFPEVAARDMIRPAEWWKSKNVGAIDPSRAFAWKTTVDERDEAIALMCDDHIRTFAYTPAERPIVRRIPLALARDAHVAELEHTFVRAAMSGTAITPATAERPGEVWLWSVREAWKARFPGTARALARARLRRTMRLQPTRTLRRNMRFGPTIEPSVN